jgi:hypothetical protein
LVFGKSQNDFCCHGTLILKDEIEVAIYSLLIDRKMEIMVLGISSKIFEKYTTESPQKCQNLLKTLQNSPKGFQKSPITFHNIQKAFQNFPQAC